MRFLLRPLPPKGSIPENRGGDGIANVDCKCFPVRGGYDTLLNVYVYSYFDTCIWGPVCISHTHIMSLICCSKLACKIGPSLSGKGYGAGLTIEQATRAI